MSSQFLARRRSGAQSCGALSAVKTVKIPRTNPETPLTSTKQVDTQVELLASVKPAPHELGHATGIADQ